VREGFEPRYPFEVQRFSKAKTPLWLRLAQTGVVPTSKPQNIKPNLWFDVISQALSSEILRHILIA
jgi:hypothetical protein